MITYADDLKPEDLYKKSLPSIMTLTVDKKDGSQALGTAFLTIKDGVAATAWHVVKNAVKVSAKFSTNEEFDVSGLIDKDEKRDIALIRVKVAGRPLLTLSSSEPAIGTKAYVIGAPQGLEFSLSDGLISQTQLLDNVKYYQFTCAASPGNSGGPLMSATGEVLGVVSKQMIDGQNLNFAVPSTYALALDSTLPTQPWVQVKEDKEVAQGSVTLSDEETDKLLGDAFVTIDDGYTAIDATTDTMSKPVYDDNLRWQLVVPSYLYLYSEQTQSVLKRLAQLRANGYRHGVAEYARDRLAEQSDLMDLLIKCITQVQRYEQWTPDARNLHSLINAKLERIEDRQSAPVSEIGAILASKMFISRIPEDSQYMSGLRTDMTGYKLGIDTFSQHPMHLLTVSNPSLAYSLGLKSDDTILSVDDKPYQAIYPIKMYLKEKRGKTIHVTVMRDGKEKKLKMRVPDDLGKPKDQGK
jgi:S1-C subfamily serine protease